MLLRANQDQGRRVPWQSELVGERLTSACLLRTLCAGATRLPARMVAGAGRPTRSTIVSVAVAGLASTATCSVCPVRWPHRSEVTNRPSPSVLAQAQLRPGVPCACQVRGQWAVVPRIGAQALAPSRLVPTGIDVTLLCQHGGLCVDEGDKHYCHCQAGYTGSYCEDEVDECSPNPCQNGATCTDYLGGFSCKVCAILGWWGGYPHESCCRRGLLTGS